ncbi:hypothetical protein [Peptacetobacter sp.]|uniref:hypothetical protein n=1 Tax=Peptacetobacter sp. TaxID=2991975 RepID=UPI00261FA51E|nr:hypothetical protein [Peptacetobacter sp.]
MSVDEKNFNEVLRKIIKQVLIEQEKISSEKNLLKKENSIYIAIDEKWDNKYYLFFEELKKLNPQNIEILFLGEKDNEIKEKFKELNICYKILKIDEFKINTNEDIVIFPVISRKDIIDIASCTDKTPVTKVVRVCFESGVKIYFMKYGIEKLTGKEPDKYKKKVLAYYKEVLEFNIEMIDDIRTVI